MSDIRPLKEYATKLPDPIKTLVLSQRDEMSEDELISKFIEWRKLLRIKEAQK